MKKTLLIGALLASTLAPVAAQAQDQHDRRELQHDRRDLREDRRDLQQDRRDFHHDRHDAGWDHRGNYRGPGPGPGHGGWNAPFGYRSFGIGVIAPRNYWGPRYYANDWQRFHVPAPRYGYYRYVRHYGDLLLINTHNGRVIQVYRGYYR